MKYADECPCTTLLDMEHISQGRRRHCLSSGTLLAHSLPAGGEAEGVTTADQINIIDENIGEPVPVSLQDHDSDFGFRRWNLEDADSLRFVPAGEPSPRTRSRFGWDSARGSATIETTKPDNSLMALALIMTTRRAPAATSNRVVPEKILGTVGVLRPCPPASFLP